MEEHDTQVLRDEHIKTEWQRSGTPRTTQLLADPDAQDADGDDTDTTDGDSKDTDTDTTDSDSDSTDS